MTPVDVIEAAAATAPGPTEISEFDVAVVGQMFSEATSRCTRPAR